jgi:hypothetical protein
MYGEHKNKGQKATGVIALMDMLANDVKKDSAESENGIKDLLSSKIRIFI